MMKAAVIFGSVLGTSAFPHLLNQDLLNSLSHQLGRRDALGISAAEGNCGPQPCPTFNAEDQFVNLSGEHQFVAPGAGDIRGPCPGLNAAANHGFLPRNGIASIEQTVSGLGALYNLGPQISAILAAYAVAIDGNVAEGVWSIGGPLPKDELTGALLGTGQGLSYSHNNYEGDSSIGRGDAYINNGDAHSLNVTRFTDVYNVAVNDGSDRYTLDKLRSKFEAAQDESIANNPYYFTGAFSTVLVVPAAYNFVINLMSNHSADTPGGYLDGYNLKSFFGVTGEPGNFQWLKGQERVPENWYRRPTYAQYEVPEVVADVAIGYLAYPKTLKFGGNTGTVNSYTGLNVANISGGVLDSTTLFQGDNFACFVSQLLQEGLPNFLSKLINDISPATDLVNKYVGPVVGGLSCPQLGNLSLGLFDHFPGYTYSPTGPDTNY